MGKTRCSVKGIALAAMIAALYTAATGVFAPIAFRQVQVRVSEALCALALFTPWAVPGLTIGCFLSNLFWSPFGLLDIALGTAATLLGTLGVTLLAKKNRVAALCAPVLSNAFLVPVALSVFLKQAYWLGVLYVGAGQAIACIGLGYPLARALERVRFLNQDI